MNPRSHQRRDERKIATEQGSGRHGGRVLVENAIRFSAPLHRSRRSGPENRNHRHEAAPKLANQRANYVDVVSISRNVAHRMIRLTGKSPGSDICLTHPSSGRTIADHCPASNVGIKRPLTDDPPPGTLRPIACRFMVGNAAM
jgi:hypothetical protein